MANTYQMMFELNAALGGGFTSAFSKGGQQVDSLKAKLDALSASGSTGDLIGGISSALETVGIVKGLEAVYDTLQDCTAAAAQFESSMAGVKRTVGGDDEFISALGESFKRLSTEVPITADELAGIATTAGQLGIAQADVEQFTTVMAQLGTTTDLTADDAATMLAQFANITGTKQYDRLGSTVASLGDATATTASKVVEMAQGMAAAASQAGMAETDILAIAAAVGSLGIESASGATSMSTLISTLYKATETGDGLADFASVAGMSAEQFRQSWAVDAVGTMNAFIQGLNDTERNGRSAVVILDELGIKNVRQTKAILGLASAGDLLNNTINQANDAWNRNTALSEKAGIMYDTTEAKMTMMQNAVSNLQIAVGDALTPAVGAVAEGITQLIQPVAEFIEQNPQIVQGLTAFVGVLGTATAALGAYTTITKLGAAASALFGASIPGVGIIMGAATAVGALVFGIGALTDAYNDANPSFESLDAQFDELNEQAKAQQAIIDLAEEYKSLSEDIAKTEAAIKFKAELDVGDVSATNLAKIDELKGKMKSETAELKQTLTLNGADKITDDDMNRLIDLAANATTSDEKLTQELQLIGIDEVTPEMIQHVRDFANAITNDSGLLEEELKLIGFDDETVKSMGYASYKDFIADAAAGNLTINADGTVSETLDVSGVAPDDLTLIKEIAEKNGYAVTADGKVTQELDLTKVKQDDLGTYLWLVNHAVDDEKNLKQTLELAGVENVTQDKLDRYTTLASNTADGTHSLKQELVLDGADNATPGQIRLIQDYATAIKNKTGRLAQWLTAHVDEKAFAKLGYSTVYEFVAAVKSGEVVIDKTGHVTQTINVEGQVDELRQAYENETALMSAEEASAEAAEELAAKRERLKAVTDALRESSGGMVTATDQETEALRNQIEAYEAVAQARKDSYTAQALDTVQKQSKQYVQSLQDEATAMRNLEQAQGRAKIAQELTAGGDAATYLRSELTSLGQAIQDYDGDDWFRDGNEQAKGLQDRFFALQETINAVTGEKHDFTGNFLPGMQAVIEHMKTDTLSVADGWQTAIDEANKYADQVEAADKIQSEYIQNLVNGVADGTMTYEQLRKALNAAYADYENGGDIVEETMKQVEAGVNAARAAAEGSGDTAQTEADKTVAAVGNIITRMDELRTAYEKAKESALTALSGKFGLFDEVGDPAQSKSTAEMEANMAAQTAYWEQYNANLQEALHKGLSTEIAKQLSDGSKESAATLATLANASEAEIAKINSAFDEVEAGKNTLAGTIADMETNFTAGMETLKTELTNTVAELDKGSEAAEAAASTMDAYVEQLAEYQGVAASEAQGIADAVNAALSSIQDVDVNIRYHTSTVPKTTVTQKDAIGTDYAAEGLTLVGEEGPELVYMNGGEKVLTANETVNALSAGSDRGGYVIDVSFSPVYNVHGGDASSIRSVMEEQNQNLYDQVRDIMEDVMTDKMRTSYA